MPAGCDFICKNEKCDNFDTGFTMTAPWPMGSIFKVIQSKKVEEHPDIREQLMEMKKQGRQFAIINFPDPDEIDIKAYRVQMWSPSAQIMWEFDIEAENEDELEDKLDNPDVPKECPKTGEPLLDFHEVTNEGVKCPSCRKKLLQNRWFTNEEQC